MSLPITQPGKPLPAEATRLFLLHDLEDSSKVSGLADADLKALQSVAHWITTFVAKPHRDLGRAGPVCPFVPRALETETLWLAAEPIGDRRAPEIVKLIDSYQNLLMDAQPVEGHQADYKALVIVFTDVSPARGKEYLDFILENRGESSYVDRGLVMGGFHEGNEGTAIYNLSFRPFTSPVPFLLIRRAVVSDWKFFLDNKDLFKHYADRFGEAAVQALAEELRGLPWRETHGKLS